MDIFGSIHNFFNKKSFFDVKLKSGLDGQEVFGHCLVLASAVPGFGQLLLERFNDDDDVTVVFPDLAGQELQTAVDEIYSSLVEELEVDVERLKSWSERLCCFSQTLSAPAEPCRVSKRAIKKRKIFEPDVGPAKRSRFGGGKTSGSVSKSSRNFGLQDVRASFPVSPGPSPGQSCYLRQG